eukprot:166947-Rhodomonas_salina.1
MPNCSNAKFTHARAGSDRVSTGPVTVADESSSACWPSPLATCSSSSKVERADCKSWSAK